MAKNSFPSRVQHVVPGSPVDAGNIGRTTRQLAARTNYLKEVVAAIEGGSLLVHRDAPLAPDVEPGMPVYWNGDNQRYERGLASAEACSDGSFATLDSADIVGMVWTKQNPTLGVVALHGLVNFLSLDGVIDGEIHPGRYYLSAATPGHIVRQRPPVSVLAGVLLGPLDACDENTWFLVQPRLRDFLEDHVHYHFKLVPLPAGKTLPPAPGERHTITDANSALQGWLPADDPVFDGRAPAGAAFGYNLSQHPKLQQLWPPIPPESAVLEQFKPETHDVNNPAGAPLAIPQTGGKLPGEKVVLDRYGIWWMTDCWAEVPWPTDLDTEAASSLSSGSSTSSSSSESSATICPLPAAMALDLWFSRMSFATDKTVVTSLRPLEGEPIEYVNCDGDPAATGDLFTRLLLTFLIDDDEFFGGQALKTITPTNRFGRGYLTEGIIAGSDAVALSSTRQRRLVPGDASTPLVHQELVTVDLNVDPAERELNPQIIRLGDALEREHRSITYIGFPSGRTSGVRLRFNIGSAGLPLDPHMRIRLVMFGLLTGTMTDMESSYFRLAAPAPTTPIVAGDTALALDTAIAVVANEAVTVESASFPVADGDTVFVSLDRLAAGAPTYLAEMGIIRAVGIVASGS